ncbi:hypothetical protein HN51_029450 [Arachis hypogaea]|uniref:BI1-like protein n=1 Tax=Arachis hypogaea TaxID=3818 RepID=A0A445BEP4_ARAHY|nr:protein LIFEGUARD 1-like [Arachis hypogaea]QHO36089.1 BI1-like protein [Arachis hypogaea]RYR37126.1 hypothetical protein Ahy_A09g042060 [Arachis hypogaea]
MGGHHHHHHEHHGKGGGDIEAGFYNYGKGMNNGNELYPGMIESPELRWGFIRKVYIIVACQLLLTALVASIYFIFPKIKDTIRSNLVFLILMIVIPLLVTIIILFALSKYYRKHPVNLILLAIYTIATAVGVGFVTSFSKGPIVFEAILLTGAVVLSLTAYTFWAVKRGHDFSFLGPFLFAASMVLLFFAIIQMIHPLGPIGRMIYSGLGALLMCGYIVFDTNNLIKVYDYDEYVWGAIAIYQDIITLFLHLLSILNN